MIWIRELGLKIQFPRLRNERLADVESAEDNPVCVTKQPSYLENAFFLSRSLCVQYPRFNNVCRGQSCDVYSIIRESVYMLSKYLVIPVYCF